MQVTHLRVNHLKNPLGYDLGIPSFSWKVLDTKSKKQSARSAVDRQRSGVSGYLL